MKLTLRKIWYYTERFLTRRYKHRRAMRQIGILVTAEYQKNKVFKKKIDRSGFGIMIQRIMMNSLK